MPATSNPLSKLILEMLRRSGPIPFSRYMALCLYHSEHGYYMRGEERTGVRGDYFTSPDLHPVFARLVARQAAEMWQLLGRPARFSWVEMGPGGGWFARDFLAWTRSTFPELFASLEYVAVEPSPRQQARIRERLQEDRLADKVRLLGSLEALEPVVGCFFSNELADSFPVAVVTRIGGHLKEIYATADGERLGENAGPISDPAVATAAARYAGRLEEGQRVEVSLAAAKWMRSVAERLERGFVITIDYGDRAERLYTPARPCGTLLAYRGHVASEDFYTHPGECDLTAHVNFSVLMDAGKEVGLDVTGFTTQERFLMALGEANAFADLYDPGQNEIERLQARLKLKRLIHPEGMGGIFKVLVQHRGVTAPKLTGLRYRRS